MTTHPDGDGGPGPGRLSDRAFVRIMRAAVVVLATVLTVVVLTTT